MCPVCAKNTAPRAENVSFPFCSPPCKLVDLGRWLDGGYRIPGEPDPEAHPQPDEESRSDGGRNVDEENG